MADDPGADFRVNLENCASEPIHIPGSIQPDGVLLAFDRAGTLTGWSANARDILKLEPQPTITAAALPIPAEARELLAQCVADMAHGDVIPAMIETTLA